MTLNINKNNFKAEVENEALPIVIDIYASWCNPCQKMMPIFYELEKEFAGKCKFVSINVDESRDISISFGVSSVPTFIFFYKGEVKTKEIGLMSKNVLKDKIEDFLLSIEY